MADAIHARTDDLALVLARAISREVHLYREAAVVPFDVLTASCAANVDAIFAAIADDTDFDTAAAKKLGVDRAGDAVPLASVMEAYRVGFRAVWDAVVTESARLATVTTDALRELTAKIQAAQQVYTDAMAVGYRDEQTRRLAGDQFQRSDLIDALLHGRLIDQCSLWDAADGLGLPSTGPYLVIAAEVGEPGTEPLPNVESKLRSLDVLSAWQPLPDLHVGILHVRTDKHFGDALALISRMATARVGVSARFDDLRDTAQALIFARVTLRGRADPACSSRCSTVRSWPPPRSAHRRSWSNSSPPQWSASPGWLTRSATSCSKRFGCGWKTTARSAPWANCSSATPIPCATACTASSGAPDVRCRDPAMSPSCAWPSKSNGG